jgi:hypothetical protein
MLIIFGNILDILHLSGVAFRRLAGRKPWGN